MTKQEQDLILSLTELEKAIAKVDYYQDQFSQADAIDEALDDLKNKIYSILLEKDNE